MSARALLPGASIGIVGGGQLGLMLARTAQRMGYRPLVLAPEERPPAAAAAEHVRASFDDVAAVRSFAAAVDVLTFEFENVSSEALTAATEVVEVRPSPAVLHVTQDRGREKAFLAAGGLPQVVNRTLADPTMLAAAVAEVGTPCVVKTAGFGYDGKGQTTIQGDDDQTGWRAAASLASAGPVVVERFVDLLLELSVVAARNTRGEMSIYDPIINHHRNHVLDLSVTPRLGEAAAGEPSGPTELPLRLDPEVATLARELTADVVGKLDLVGLCCVEYFLAEDGSLLVNEIAPRPHNSGHLTIEAAVTDQFEQQLRAVCGLPLGSSALKTSAAMANLLGDVWLDSASTQNSEAPTTDRAAGPDFASALATEGVSLHLYGKREARRGRKMGHLTAVGASPAAALASVLAARRAL